eukprot:s2290_g8.t1
MLTEAEKEWVVYMEEAALIDYLEGHFTASTRQLWDHLSTRGSFPDQLPVTEGMIHEDLPRFFQLRQWPDALRRMMPARTHFTTERRQQQWQRDLQGWMEDTRDELDHLCQVGWGPVALLRSVLTRAHRRGSADYIRPIGDVITLAEHYPTRRQPALAIGEAGWIGYEAWVVDAEPKLYCLFSLPVGGMVENAQTPWPTTNNTLNASEHDEQATSSTDAVSLVGHKINKRWLKSPSPRRKRPRGASPKPTRITTETYHLSSWAEPRRRDDTARPKECGRKDASERASSSRMKPKPKARPVSGTAKPPAGRDAEKARGSADPAPTPLTMQEAVSNWLVWLGIMEVDDEPARFLPRDIEHRILDNFMDLDPTDELTSALALTSMIQQLMASVGGVLQDAMQMAARRRQEGQGRDQGDTEVDVEVETEEAGLMQTTLSSSWYTLLHQLRTYLAMPRAVQGSLWPCSPPPWLTCARECTTWALEWWARLEPHLPISTGSACCRSSCST